MAVGRMGWSRFLGTMFSRRGTLESTLAAIQRRRGLRPPTTERTNVSVLIAGRWDVRAAAMTPCRRVRPSDVYTRPN